MQKGSGKDRIILIDQWTMKELIRFQTASEASKKLGISLNTIYGSLSSKKPVFDCYWVYEKNLASFKPAQRVWKRVRGNKVNKEIEKLRNDR